MKVGIDFDNTIVDYNSAFHAAALKEGLIPDSLSADKVSVRRHLVEHGEEEAWTRLQGYVYGPGISRAVPYDGVLEFFAEASGLGLSLVIVSHKTRAPYLGPPYDLHAAALEWIGSRGISEWVEAVFFETTQEAKLGRIAGEGCDCFIDDLPEILRHPLFPSATRPIHFAPGDGSADPGMLSVAQWKEIPELLHSLKAGAKP